jgi:hypothetical protein
VADAHARAADARVPAAERRRCLECAFAALHNWEAMVERLRRDERDKAAVAAAAGKHAADAEEWREESARFFEAAKSLERDDIATRIEFGRWKLWTYVTLKKLLLQVV